MEIIQVITIGLLLVQLVTIEAVCPPMDKARAILEANSDLLVTKLRKVSGICDSAKWCKHVARSDILGMLKEASSLDPNGYFSKLSPAGQKGMAAWDKTFLDLLLNTNNSGINAWILVKNACDAKASSQTGKVTCNCKEGQTIVMAPDVTDVTGCTLEKCSCSENPLQGAHLVPR